MPPPHSPEEPVAFARQKDKMKLFIRTIGMARAKVKIGIANIACNLQHAQICLASGANCVRMSEAWAKSHGTTLNNQQEWPKLNV